MSFPPESISKDVLIGLIDAAKDGDQSAFEALLEQYTPLIDSMTERFGGSARSKQDKEDLRQEAIICFYRAMMRFDTKQERVQFGFYAKECIRNGLISSLRAFKKHEHVLLWDGESQLDTATEPDEDPVTEILENEAYLEVSKQICNALSPYENRIWWLFLAGRTAKEIARLTEKDERSVQNAIYRIRKKLRAIIPYS
ncbi:MAG: sigma-70 family RNA polymerase sigma factor [Clostridia bacterium]|nr:sigma-70 family RNA polymerase sigma factor [Clostridia bacterium]MBQ3014730.1 sigma-70 family RNA polymerase sigma factor [Clostridia bacterium]